MQTARKFGLTAATLGLGLTPICLLSASVPNFPPNPVGEKLYRAQLQHETLLPVVIIACALLAACIIQKIAHRKVIALDYDI